MEETYYQHDKSAWTVFFLWGEEKYGRSRSASLHIDDETGMPLKIVHTMGQANIFFEVNEETNDIKSSTGLIFKL